MITVSKQTELYVWNVEKGTAIYTKTPNGKNVVIDCGATDGFSPAECLKDILGVGIDFLVISHPHRDHIEDLEGIDGILNTGSMFGRNKDITKDLMIESDGNLKYDELLDKYFELSDRYKDKVDDKDNPRKPNWGDGCAFKHFKNDLEDGAVDNATINNLSLVTFIQFGKDVVLYGGDMEKSGWEDMLGIDGFETLLKKTTIYIASHHGHESGFSAKLFEHFEPKLTIVPAGKKQDWDVTDKYYDKTEGMVVTKDDKEETREVVTTRKDDHIHVTLYDDAEPTVELGWQPKT